jgi:elongation factor G
VDFTIEVERALRVLDGAILILCGVGGVQPQTLTVNKQMLRYNVPRLIFVNKLDRMGADPWSAIYAAREKLGICCAAVQVPIGEDERLRGLIDIIHKRAYYFDGANGENIREEDVPVEFNKIVGEKYKELVGELANIDPEL